MVTIGDVASHAAVSRATVSRVVNGHPSVDPVLTRRVRRAIKELGYQPSRTAQALRRQRSQVWNLIISDIRNGFFGEVARGVEDVAQDAGFAVVLCNSDERLDKERAYIDLAVAERVAGVILSPASVSETSLESLRQGEVPVVLVDREIVSSTADMVALDNRTAAASATRHLLANGFSRIACISGPSAASTAEQRTEGYCDALRSAGVDVDPELIRRESFKRDGGEAGIRALMQLAPPPDAVLIGNAPQCAGALAVLRSLGTRIPDDLGVVTFDDEVWMSLMTPDVSAVAQPAYDIGVEAATLLLRRLHGDAGTARRLLMDAEIRQRASSSRPRSKA
ncbi:MAG: LacI family DNA-binding transcriptional regulator [Solirubrobacterales bacterium]